LERTRRAELGLWVGQGPPGRGYVVPSSARFAIVQTVIEGHVTSPSRCSYTSVGDTGRRVHDPRRQPRRVPPAADDTGASPGQREPGVL
jgi:hypothetical protein